MKTPHLRNFLVIVVCLFGSGAMAWATRLAFVPPPPETLVVTPNRTVATEQEWIVGDVVRAIAGMARSTDTADVKVKRGADVDGHASFDVTLPADHQQVTVVNHIWSPEMYAPLAQHLLGGASTPDGDEDLAARDALTDLRVEILLAQNRRISDALKANMRSATAHESAALLVGTFALREVSNYFGDVRPALSRMAAHLAIARALRHGEPMSRDGELALVILTDLSGLQRDALDLLNGYHGVPAPGSPDRAWIRALQLRITGDWRKYHPVEGETLLEAFEYSRAVRQRVGIDSFLDYFDTIEPRTQNLPDWSRIAYSGSDISVEAGHVFTDDDVHINHELDEAKRVWAAFHSGDIDRHALIRTLNDRASGPAVASAGATAVNVLDWGMWAASYQRHLCNDLVFSLAHMKNLGGDWRIDDALEQFEPEYGQLTLYPVVVGSIMDNDTRYAFALDGARPIADSRPELLTAGEWNQLLKHQTFRHHQVAFPVNVSWFEPAEPEGTAFDLQYRSLQPGCLRPPTLERAAWFARVQPYDEWTVWSNAWYSVKGKPSADAIRRAFGPLAEYDDIALRNFVGNVDLSRDAKLELMQRRCELTPGNCAALASWLLLDNREADALKTFERLIANSRDEVDVSNHLAWIVRYYRDHGRLQDAEQLAARGARTQSGNGLQTLGDLLDAEGHDKEAEDVYRMIAEHYDDSSDLGVFLARRAMEAHDKALEAKAFDLLRADFPNGLQRVAMYALDERPVDGVSFQTFGRRLASMGFDPQDVIVAVDGWRIRNWTQHDDALRLGRGESVTFVVWRKGEYREIHARVPQRWLGATLQNYVDRRPPQR
jgi:hypothetical protein